MRTIIKKIQPIKEWEVVLDNEEHTITCSKNSIACIRYLKNDKQYYCVIENYAFSKADSFEDAVDKINNPSIDNIIAICNIVQRLNKNE